MRTVAADAGCRSGLLLALLLLVCASVVPHASAVSLGQHLLEQYGLPPYTSARLSGPDGVVDMVPGIGACLRLAGLRLDSVTGPDWTLLAPLAVSHNIAMLDLRSVRTE